MSRGDADGVGRGDRAAVILEAAEELKCCRAASEEKLSEYREGIFFLTGQEHVEAAPVINGSFQC